MKKDDFVDLMGEIDDSLIQQTNAVRQKKRRRWIGPVSLAACLIL